MNRISGLFIKANRPFFRGYRETDLAPLFRRRFTLPAFSHAEICVCALGMGVFYINGKPMTEDLHISPTSDYTKTIWFNRYDVTSLLHEGDNLISCILGNGWYNESLPSVWNYCDAIWRDNPKFALRLYIDGIPALESDESWLCKPESWITFNQLRSGEHADMRLYEADWTNIDFEDSSWSYAIVDEQPPKGRLRECYCPPVRACGIFPAKTVRQTGPKRYLFDIEQNISGFVRLRVHQRSGDIITIRYSEQVLENGERKDNQMPPFFPASPFQTDILILSDEEIEYSPMFTYHGFRYIEVDGLDAANLGMVDGIYTHLDIAQTGFFSCSNQDLNDLFRIGVNASYSNMHYILTDCPTREMFGWLNDARASAEQLLMNFDIVSFFNKWFQDILDSVRESDGAIPGIAPTSGCLYDMATGPICSSALHEIAYKTYIYTGDNTLLVRALPYMLRHLDYLRSKENEDGLIGFGLYDWGGPFSEDFNLPAPTPVTLTDTALYCEYLERAHIAAEHAKSLDLLPWLQGEYKRIRSNYMRSFVASDGYCVVNEQTAVAMTLVLGLFDDPEPLKKQLKACVEAHDFHMHCGMLGIRFLYDALNIAGVPEYAYRIIAAEGFPSFTQWLRQGATTLWELFYDGASKNHHMYSSFMLFLMDTLAGIRFSAQKNGEILIDIAPQYVEGLDWCHGERHFNSGALIVYWKRDEIQRIHLSIDVPEGITCQYLGSILPTGKSVFMISGN